MNLFDAKKKRLAKPSVGHGEQVPDTLRPMDQPRFLQLLHLVFVGVFRKYHKEQRSQSNLILLWRKPLLMAQLLHNLRKLFPRRPRLRLQLLYSYRHL